MNSDTPAGKKQPKRSCLWLGLKILVFTGLTMLVLAVIFHRPLLRLVVDKAGRHFAERAGLSLDWSVQGNMVSALGLKKVNAKGEKGLLRNLQWDQLALRYDLPAFWRQGLAGVLGEVSLHDAVVELDLRSDGAAEPKLPQEAKKKAGLPDVWVGRLDLQNVTLRLQTEGGEILVRGLTLQLARGEVGRLHIEELIVPSARLHLHQVTGQTEVQGRSIILHEVALREGVQIQTLVASLMSLSEGNLPLVLDLRSGEGRLTASGSLTGLGQKLGLDLEVAVEKISDADVAPWAPMPENIHWRVEHAALKTRGYPAEPQALDFEAALEAQSLQAAGQNIQQVLLKAESKRGVLQIKDLFAFVEENQLAVNGKAQLPSRWTDMKRTEAGLEWRLHAPALEKFKPGAGLAGSVLGEGTFGVREGRLTGAQGLLQGYRLRWQDVPPALLHAEFTTDGDWLNLQSLRFGWDSQHELSTQGRLQLSGEQRAEMTWKLTLPEAGRFLPESVQQKLGQPFAASVASEGKANFTLPALKARNWPGIVATTVIKITDVSWRDARLQSLDLQAAVREGQLQVPQLRVVLDENNHLNAEGKAALDMKGPFSATVKAELPQLPVLADWLGMAKAPALEAGSLSLNWQAKGRLDRQELSGRGRVLLKDVRIKDREEVLGLTLEADHTGMTAEVRQLEASAGPWRASGTLKLTQEALTIPQLTLQSEDLRLLQVRAQVPLALTQQPRPALPLDFAKPWQVDVDMEQLDVGQLGDVIGVKAPLRGKVDGGLKISGSAGQPVAELDMALTDARVEALQGKLEPASLKLQATLKEDRLQATAELNQNPLQPLKVEAQAPLNLEEVLKRPQQVLDAPLQATVNLPSSDIAVVRRFVPVLKTLKGTVVTELKIEGPLRSPQWQGRLNVDVTDAAIENLPMHFREMKVHLAFDQTVVRLQDVSASVAGGEMRVGGQVDLKEITNPSLDLHLEAREALLMRDQTMSLRTDGRVTCQGVLNKATLAGKLELVRGRVFKEVEFLPLSLPNQLPPAPPPVTRSERKLELPPLLKDWTFDVDVRTRDPIRLLGNVLNGGVVVRMNARGSGAAPELEGRVTLTGARVQLPFSRLNISRGEVIFNKENPFDPVLDLQGDSFINNYQVTLYAYGPALAPKLRFTSSPPLSEAEIATLLATGATTGDLRSSEGVAANRAAFLLISQTYRKLFRKAAPRRYDEEPPKLSFSFSPLNTGGAQRSVSATYELSPKLQAVGIVAERGSFRGLLYYLVRFR